MATIFLTGGTGLLGTEITSRLIEEGGHRICALVRAADGEEAAHRLRSMWQHDERLRASVGAIVTPVAGDFTKPGLGLDEDTRRALQGEVDMVIHAGAQVGMQKSEEELMLVNAEGTRNVLGFAAEADGLKRFVHVSTAYVAGRRTGTILEEGSVGDAFSGPYEKSKAEAERLVRESGLPFVICRPGMIVGDSVTGWTRNFNTIYYVLKLMLKGRLNVMPVRKDHRLNIVPADYVAGAVVKAAGSEAAEGRTLHLTCPEAMQPKAEDLARYVRVWASVNLGLELPKTRFAQMPAAGRAGLAYNRRKAERKKNAITNMLAILPYFFEDREFDRTNTDAIAGPYNLPWRGYIGKLLDFACRKNFMEQTGRTVFEQANVRRDSSRFPIRYFDVAADGIRGMSGQEANVQIERIRSALWAWGIRKGDRVALTGINSIDYMTIDHAIGLLGAVSVPIYYTTPAEEIQALLDRSGAAWIFVGDRRIMAGIGQLRKDIRVVAFSEGLEVRKPGVILWEEFLGMAETAPRQLVDPGDLATIRYTSGTTGDPKGVKFDFGQLAWMGEVLTNLLSWEDRNRSMRYMSFLPLSHVVEGILASYAPYYVLCDVEYYFLNDFGRLAEMLPKVRPNVFFSVPRFYEKVWDQLTENALGKRWLAMADGPAKRTLAGVLRRVILRKAGLDRCKQLIVGSAPVSEELLRNFRELGIEIYNAYGQAEAPLITINRFGDNVIPTIGTPLPETAVEAAEDGELIVTGPQVCRGYYGMETDTIRDGVLKTGDLGRIREDGHITLYGRKKEMIITAYGKNISIPKIEERLKNINGVSEAVLIGEKRPYCTALIWLDREVPDLRTQIDAMNEDLSHPEQIRRFTVIDRPLSIAQGELTPNLKVRRHNVEEHFTAEIEEMYT